MPVRVIKPSTVRAFERKHTDAASGLEYWLEVVAAAHWKKLHDVRLSFRSADEVKVASGRTIVVFNIGGNKYRLITAIHYNVEKVFVLRFTTHAEYSKDRWKDEL
jgi:mRNA interferase HigB